MAQSLYRSLNEAAGGGEALRMPLPGLDMEGVRFRKGQVTIIGAAPGGGKTALMLNIAHLLREYTILYLSPDSDVTSVGARMVATMKGVAARKIFSDFDSGARAEHMETTKELKHIQFSFQPQLTFEDISEELEAYQYIFGHFPDMIVLDNIRDVYPDETSEGEHNRHGATVDFFHKLARDSGSACVLLHHLRGEYEDSTVPPPLSALLGKISKQASLVLNAFSPDDQSLGVVIAKNRNGKASPSGEDYVHLSWDRYTQVIS